ncbi:MAG: hypothetical protein ACOCXA_07875, partial [Planctomycetota bacterium]
MTRLMVGLLMLFVCGVAAEEEESPFYSGPLDMIYVRVDFSDMPGEPLSLEQAQASMQELDTFIRANSYDQAWVASEFTELARMPRTAEFYEQFGVIQLKYDVWGWLSDQGKDFTDYHVVIIAFDDSPIDINGKSAADGGNGNVMLGGHFQWHILAHEVGHAIGLPHANRWKIKDGSPNHPGSSGSEYGDKFDVMGGGKKQEHHFGAWFKNRLKWIPDSDRTEVEGSGVFTIAAHDHAESAGSRLLRLPRDPEEDYVYWISYRQAVTDLAGGINIVWERNVAPEGMPDTDSDSYLIDTVPTTSSLADSSLAIGQSLRDEEAGFTITTLSIDTSGSVPTATVEILFDDDPIDDPIDDPSAPRRLRMQVTSGGGSVPISCTLDPDEGVAGP